MIQIAIIEDDRDMTDFLREIIDADEEMQCISTYYNVEDALVFIPRLAQPPDVVIVDIHFEATKLDGIEGVRQLRPLCSPSTQFMMHTVFATQDKIFAALKAGATGYVDKEVSPEKVIMAIREMCNKGASISPAIAKKMIEFFRPGPVADLPQLKPAENRLLHLLAKGYRYREIAEEVGNSTNNIKQQIHKMYEKLHVRNRTEAVNKLHGG
ncbi:DNA-binding response regulator [Lewinellaceae bacterium SD302]|nr:DNA-binding response regulator [Lewinellaceae bacterium SD302]